MIVETRREEFKNFIAMLFPLYPQIRHIQQRYIHSIIPSIEMLCPCVHAFNYLRHYSWELN